MIKVTLKTGFLARDVRLVTVVRENRWHIAAMDQAGGLHNDVTIDGDRPAFDGEDSALAFLHHLAARHGVDLNRIWAEPDVRTPRAYLVPGRGAALGVTTC